MECELDLETTLNPALNDFGRIVITVNDTRQRDNFVEKEFNVCVRLL